MINVTVNETQVEYYEKQIDELERQQTQCEQLLSYQRKRADTWRIRYEELLSTVTEERLA